MTIEQFIFFSFALSIIVLVLFFLLFRKLFRKNHLRPDQLDAIHHIIAADRYCPENEQHNKIALLVAQVLREYQRNDAKKIILDSTNS